MKTLLTAIACVILFACSAPQHLPPLLTPGEGKVMYRSLWKVERVTDQLWQFHRLTEWEPAPAGFKLNNGPLHDNDIIYQIIYK